MGGPYGGAAEHEIHPNTQMLLVFLGKRDCRRAAARERTTILNTDTSLSPGELEQWASLISQEI